MSCVFYSHSSSLSCILVMGLLLTKAQICLDMNWNGLLLAFVELCQQETCIFIGKAIYTHTHIILYNDVDLTFLVL